MTTTTDPWDTPPPPVAANGPSMKQLRDRLLFIEPKKFEANLPASFKGAAPGQTQDRVTADITFLDGEPIAVVLDKDDDVVGELDPPLTRGKTQVDRFISQRGLVTQTKNSIGRAVLGRLRYVKLDNGNKAFELEEPSDADKDVARRFLAWRNSQQVNQAAAAVQPAAAPAAPPAAPTPPAAPPAQEGGFDSAPAAPATAPDAPDNEPAF